MNIIHSIMLVALGFLSASILALLFSRAVWRRAVRLTTKRLRAELPASWRDVQADRDQMRAEYAIKFRQLEILLDKAREKSVQQMVAVNQHKAALKEQQEQIRILRTNLAERASKTTVLEQTVRQRLPELMSRLEKAMAQLEERDQRIAKLRRGIEKQTAALNQAAQTERLRQAEIQRLRQALDAATRNQGARAASQKEFRTLRAQNKRLVQAVEVLKKEVAAAKQFELQQAPMLREEMARLGDTIARMATTAQKGAVLTAATAHGASVERPERPSNTTAKSAVTLSKKNRGKKTKLKPLAATAKTASAEDSTQKTSPAAKNSQEKASNNKTKRPASSSETTVNKRMTRSKKILSDKADQRQTPPRHHPQSESLAQPRKSPKSAREEGRRASSGSVPPSSQKTTSPPERPTPPKQKSVDGVNGTDHGTPPPPSTSSPSQDAKNKTSLADRLRRVKERQAK